MATEPSRRAPGGILSDLEPEERRGWLSHGIAALAISALGLAVAGSVVLTTNAQTTTAVVPPQTTVNQAQPQGVPQQGSKLPGQLPGVGKAPATADVPAIATFSRRSGGTEDESRSAAVRDAIIEERAAQRSEDLTESAEDIASAALERGSEARKAELAKSDRARRLAAVQIAQERTKKAIQVRVAAEVQRELAAKQATTNTPAEPSTPGPEASTDPADIPSGGGAASPVPGAIVGASFGATGAWARYHTGLDFRAGFGTPIRAVTAGVVTFAGNKGNWAGNHVAIRHAGGYSTLSAHMQSMAVHDGESVQAGQVIGYVGATGRAFGAHLHFEVYPPGVNPGDVYSAINPLPWLRARGVNTN